MSFLEKMVRAMRHETPGFKKVIYGVELIVGLSISAFMSLYIGGWRRSYHL